VTVVESGRTRHWICNDIGKPLVVEEISSLSCSLEEMNEFIDQSSGRMDGWVSHCFGRSIEEYAASAELSGMPVAEFFEYWQDKGTRMPQ